jgi:hypothetical protein
LLLHLEHLILGDCHNADLAHGRRKAEVVSGSHGNGSLRKIDSETAESVAQALAAARWRGPCLRGRGGLRVRILLLLLLRGIRWGLALVLWRIGLLSAWRTPLALGTCSSTQQNDEYQNREEMRVLYCLHDQILLAF